MDNSQPPSQNIPQSTDSSNTANPEEVHTGTANSQQVANQHPKQHTGVSEDTKTLVTVLLLIFAFPIGVVVMFFWPKWRMWVKLLISLPLTLLLLAVLLGILLVAANPADQIENAECVSQCTTGDQSEEYCIQYCAEMTSIDE
ncbi:MAG: hypothetical protein WDZ94_02460 [Patescibacteria group bacterium]